jgi:hypothetical protein
MELAAAAMTFDEVSMERSKTFVFALQVPYHTIPFIQIYLTLPIFLLIELVVFDKLADN